MRMTYINRRKYTETRVKKQFTTHLLLLTPKHTSIVFTWQHCARSYIVSSYFPTLIHLKFDTCGDSHSAGETGQVSSITSLNYIRTINILWTRPFIIATSYTRKMCGVHVFLVTHFIFSVYTQNHGLVGIVTAVKIDSICMRCHILARMHRKFHYITALDKPRHTNREHLKCHRSPSILPNFFVIFFSFANFTRLLDPERP